jgi:hypothetical protein
MRRDLIGLAVAAISALGLTAATADRARAYVVRNPDGAYAPLALKLLVELDARYAVSEGDLRAYQRRLMVGDLVYRPSTQLKAKPAGYSEDEGNTFSNGRQPAAPTVRTRPGVVAKPAATSPQQARKAVQYLQSRSKRFGSEARRCTKPPPLSEYFDCLADSIETYASAVEAMPPTANSVAPVAAPALRQAARRIRTARSVEEARTIVAETAAVIAKSIDLVEAGGEDTVRRLEISQRSVVAASLEIVDDSLVQAMGI